MQRLRQLFGRLTDRGAMAAPVAVPAPPPPRAPFLLALSMVKNEQDIIEPFIRHTAGLVDFLLVLDNRSADATRRIAFDCARELGNVAVADTPEFGYTQSERMTALLRHAQDAFFADFVLLLDADEFLGVPDRASLLAALASIPPGSTGLIPWRTHVLRAEDAAALDPPRGIRWRRGSEPARYHKAILRLEGQSAASITIGQGNHSAVWADGTPLPGIDMDGLPLLHAPVRSLAQIRAKAVAGWAASLARDPLARQQDLAFQWRDAFDDLVEGRMATAEDLARVSLRYALPPHLAAPPLVEDPMPFDYPRRHSTGAFGEDLALVARAWENSLTAAPVLLGDLVPNRDTAVAGIGGTAFSGDWHWQNLFADVAPFRFIAELIQPEAVLDLGCGIGAYLELFRRCGATVLRGLDGMDAAASVLGAEEYAVADLAAPQDLGRRFDLVLCTEVAEHLDEAAHAVLAGTIDRHAAGIIVFSAAETGQPGHGHISCKPIAYWLAIWAELGWSPDYGLSCAMRGLATLSWFRRNLLVLRRGPADPHAVERLAQIGAKPFGWYSQAPGIRHYAFTEPMPDRPAGYAANKEETP